MTDVVEHPSLPKNEKVFTVASGTGPVHFWARTCPTPGCDCRDAVLVAARDLGELVPRLSAIRDSTSAKHTAAALDRAKGEHLVAFRQGLDAPIASPVHALDADEPLDDAARAMAALVNGELLERIADLWIVGKGYPPLGITPAPAPGIVSRWKRNDFIPYAEVYAAARADLYRCGERWYAALDCYCTNPDCNGEHVAVQFHRHDPEQTRLVGTIIVERPDREAVEPSAPDPVLARELWTLYRRRHGDVWRLFEERARRMKEFGKKLWAPPVPKRPRRWVSSSSKQRRRRG